MKPSFFSGCHPEKIQVGKSIHLFKTKNRVQIKGASEQGNDKNQLKQHYSTDPIMATVLEFASLSSDVTKHLHRETAISWLKVLY